MNYQSFFMGFILLALVLAIIYVILEQRGSIIGSMVDLFVGLFIGIIYSVAAACIFTSWAYPIRVLAGSGAGIVVGWSLVMTAGPFFALLNGAVKLIRKNPSSKGESDPTAAQPITAPDCLQLRSCLTPLPAAGELKRWAASRHADAN